MTQTEALKLALEAMESFQNGTNGLYEGEFQEEITAIKEALAQPKTKRKPCSPCPEFWDWLPKAYNFEGDGNFTKYNMEVAFLAGKQASQPEPPPECQTEALKLALEALEKMDARFGNTTFRHEIQPSTYGCHHISETCSLCEGLVTGWKAVRAANQAITTIKEALMSLQDGAKSAVAEQHKQEPCPDKERDEYACKNRHQCWAPCGELGKSEEHAQPKEPEQEPVAWRAWFDADNSAKWLFTLWPEEEHSSFDWQPLYTTPPQRKPLTDEQEREAFEKHWYDYYHCGSISPRTDGTYIHPAVQKAWEAWQARAAHNIKGGA